MSIFYFISKGISRVSCLDSQINIYNQILDKADEVVYTSKQYHRGCMYARNRHLVKQSNICLCYSTRDTGGTAYTVNYARQKGLQIINLAAE